MGWIGRVGRRTSYVLPEREAREDMSVAVVCPPVPQINATHCHEQKSYDLRETLFVLFSTLFRIDPDLPPPGLASSFPLTGISRKGRFFLELPLKK